MLRHYQIVNNKIEETADEKSPILMSVNPDEKEKRLLIDTYCLDEHTLNSALDPDEQARLECEPNHIAIVLKRPKNYSGEDQLLFKATTVGVFFFGEFLIIVLSEDTNLFEGKPFSKVSSPREVLLKLIYRSIFHFLEHLKIINLLSDEVEQKINRAMENRFLINLFTLQKSLVYYQNAINSNGVLIEKVRHNSARIGFTPEESELLEDIVIENNQCYRQAEVYSNILASLMDARASIVSNNLNVLMKTLNIITISIMVPTLVVSIFSMNVKIPMAHHPFAFLGIMGLSAVAMSAFLVFWKYRKW
ncbi:MAG: divalent metal ion transporter [Candidatus Aminicenantes bacterium RBG_19FT_COMBO_58_17]|jgi:magnesium transporter|nr:MAG: divalent metal ion transporter [Candidatus Aminicenantes bacterium RBG_19FT_COMBO_58_17]HCS49100.1 divalent metal ion transporter [Candidatus Aminicenantes bacterium]